MKEGESRAKNERKSECVCASGKKGKKENKIEKKRKKEGKKYDRRLLMQM